MKKYPYPDKQIKTKDDIEKYIVESVTNLMSWMRIDGYTWWISFPTDSDFAKMNGSGLVVTTEYPYKKFHISIQQDSIDKMLDKKSFANKALWRNVEKSLLHEMFHVLLHRLVAVGTSRFVSPSEMTDHEEYLVDHLAGVFYPCIEESRKKK